MPLLLVVNLHGKIDSASGTRKALAELKVERKFSASVVGDDPSTVGMLRLCKDYVAWSPLDVELLTALLRGRAMVSESKRLDDQSLSKLGFKNHQELAERMLKEGTRLSAVEGIRPFFRLSPPKGGFKGSMRRQYTEKGVLGRNPKLPDIVRRMI